jgi:hypothetical protein
MERRKFLVVIGVSVALLIALSLGLALAFTGGDGSKSSSGPPTTEIGPPSHPHQFASVNALPSPNTRIGAEVRVLSEAAIAATPAAVRPLILALAKNGGLVRQNTFASCYLNAAGTERVCTMTIRRGTKPWAQIRYNVLAASGQVVYHGYTLWLK